MWDIFFFYYYNMTKILITGGNGYLAKELYNYLINMYDVYSPNKYELNLLNKTSIDLYFKKYNYFDIVIHTAIVGGKKNVIDTYDIFYNNLKMFFNIYEFKHRYNKFINMGSGASYNRSMDINGNCDILNSNPDDFYGFSKNIIERIILNTENMYNIRIFNIFSDNENESRFIKTCIHNINNSKNIIIDNDRFFDFFNVTDFFKVIQYYINNDNLHKDIDLCYENKYKLSEIANILIKKYNSEIKIFINSTQNNNYTGNHTKLYSYNINFDNYFF